MGTIGIAPVGFELPSSVNNGERKTRCTLWLKYIIRREKNQLFDYLITLKRLIVDKNLVVKNITQ